MWIDIIRSLTYGLIIALSTFFARIIVLRLFILQDHDKNQKILLEPRIIFILGIALFLLCSFIITLCLVFLYDDFVMNLAVAVVMFVPLIASVYLILHALIWQIEIKDDSFIYRGVFIRKREYKYSEITKTIRIKIGGFKIYVNKVKITVNYWIKSRDNLWDIIKLLDV